MNKWLLVAILCLGLSFLLRPGLSFAQSCTDSSQCASGICNGASAGTCQTGGSGVPGPNNGYSCYEDSDCGGGDFCGGATPGTCQSSGGGGCSQGTCQTECSVGQTEVGYCGAGVCCVGGGGGTCTSDSDCSNGFRCDPGGNGCTCVSGTRPGSCGGGGPPKYYVCDQNGNQIGGPFADTTACADSSAYTTTFGAYCDTSCPSGGGGVGYYFCTEDNSCDNYSDMAYCNGFCPGGTCSGPYSDSSCGGKTGGTGGGFPTGGTGGGVQTYSGGLTDPLKNLVCSDNTKGLACLANKIVDFLITISVPIVAIMVLYGGFLIMTAGGDPAKFKNGRSAILYAAIGFVVVLAAKAVVVLIKNIFGVGT